MFARVPESISSSNIETGYISGFSLLASNNITFHVTAGCDSFDRLRPLRLRML